MPVFCPTGAQAGLSSGFQAFYITISMGVGLGAAMAALVGNALGAGDRSKTRRLAAQGMSYGVIAALILAIAGQWYGPEIIQLVSKPGVYRDAGIRCYLWLSLALPGFLVAFDCNGIIQAHGDGRSMQRALMVPFFANAALNPLLIYGIPGLVPGFGFDGAAISTVISQTGVMLYKSVRSCDCGRWRGCAAPIFCRARRNSLKSRIRRYRLPCQCW